MFEGGGFKRERSPPERAGEAVENSENAESTETDEQRAKRHRRESGASDPGDWASAFDDSRACFGGTGFGTGTDHAGAGNPPDPYGDLPPRNPVAVPLSISLAIPWRSEVGCTRPPGSPLSG